MRLAGLIVDVLASFLKAFENKRPDVVAAGKWRLHWDNAPVHTSKTTKEFLEKKKVLN